MRIDGAGYNTTLEITTNIHSNQNTQNTQENQNTSEKISYDGRSISQISPVERRDMPVSEKVVIDAIEKANKAIMGANKRFEFNIHEKTKQIMIKVIDTDTNEVVREIPNEKILDMVAKMCEMAGILVDERR